VLSAADGTIAGLVGASPGASTAVPAMLDVMERCFSDRYPSWLPKLKEMVPSLGTELSNEPALFEEVWSWGTGVLKLDKPANGVQPAPPPVEAGADIRVTVAAE
jgi:malate dehydrogenase (quinone)